MKWYKSFREQCKECDNTANRFIIEDYFHSIYRNGKYYPIEVIACVPFRSYCNSGNCRNKREKEGE